MSPSVSITSPVSAGAAGARPGVAASDGSRADTLSAMDTCSPGAAAPNALSRICDQTRLEVSRRKAAVSLESMRGRAVWTSDEARGFGRALMDATVSGRFGLIGEIKKASPSGGLFRPDFDPAALARAYRAGGAHCLSVLTDGPHFQGSAEHLRAARAAVDLPVLRKDFILDPWQVYESRSMGADCILLIMAALSDDQAVDLEGLARALDLDVLVEVHDRRELDRALGLQTKLIGINNRDLKTLKTDLSVTEELAPHVPPDRFLISESGMRSRDDLNRLADIGVHCFLVGESLIRQDDVEAATRKLLNG
jgi:indole-3-glycerol phosphate synthase